MRFKTTFFFLFAFSAVNAQFVDIRTDSLITKVPLRFRNLNEGLGKVLTSDATGIATWQSIPSSTSNWQVVGTNSTRGGFNNTITDGTSNTVLIGETNNQSAGQYLYGLGWGLELNGFSNTVLGAFNSIPTSSNTAWVATDPLFAVGNGQSNAARSNALMILKNGNVGVGLNTPSNLLHLHQKTNTEKSMMRLTNTATGNLATDGLEIGFEPNVLAAKMFNRENSSLSLGTNNVERINISNTGAVAIGTSSASGYKLYVNGSSAIIGDLLVNNLAGTGTRPLAVDPSGFLVEGTASTSTNTYSKYHNISAASARYIGTTGSTNFQYMATACLAYFSSAVKKGDGQIILPVEFPDGAELGTMSIHAVDNIIGDFMEATLFAVPKTGVSTAQVAIKTVNTSSFPVSPAVQLFSLGFSPIYTVDNQNFFYYILVDISSSTDNWNGNSIALRGINFKYSITY